MKYFVQKLLIATIIFQLSLPTVSWAVNEQIPTLLLSSEQSFLQKLQDRNTNNWLFQMNKKDAWKAIPGTNGWEVIKKDFSYGNLTVGIKKEDVRFVIQPRKNSNELTVVVYRKVRGEWIPRYGSDAQGQNYVTERLDLKGNIVSKDITPANVEEKLIKAHVAYRDDRFEKIKAIRQHFLAKLPKKDVYQRQLAEQIFGSSQSDVKATGPLQTVLKDWIDVPALDKSTAEFVVAGAIQSMINMHRKFEGKSTAQNWKNYFATTDNGIKQETMDSKTFQKIKEMVIQSTPEPTNYSNYVTTIQNELEPFNRHIRSIQAICTLKQADHSTEQNKLGKVPTITDQSSAEDMKKFADYTSQSLQITNAQAELAKNGASVHLEYITHKSPLAMFVWTAENTQHELGEFTPDGCIHDGGKVNLHEISLASTTWAYQKVNEMLIETINQSIDLIESKPGKYDYDNELTKYIRSAPLAVKNALGTRKVIDEVTYVGQRVREIYAEDKFNRNLDYTIMAVAFAGGIASGFGVGGMVYVMSAADAVAFLRGGSQWYNNHFLEPIQRQAMAANQIDRDQGLKAIKQNEKEQSSGLITATIIAGGNAVGFGLGKVLKPAENVEQDFSKAQKIEKISTTHVPNSRVLRIPETAEEIVNFNETVAKAEAVLGRELSPHGRSLVWNAHLYGQGGDGKILGTTAGIGNYKTETNTIKLKIASEDGHGEVSLQEAKKLADSNVLGSNATDITQLTQAVDPSMIKAQQLIEQKKQPVQKKTIYESVKDGEMDVVQVKGLPQNANLYNYGNNEVFRHYIASSETVSEIVEIGTLKAGTNSYVVIHPGVRKEIYDDITGTFITKPGFSPKQVGLDNVNNMDYVDFTIKPGVGLLQLEPGIFVVPGQPTIPNWIKDSFVEFKLSGSSSYPTGLEDIFKRMGQMPDLEGSQLDIVVKEYRKNGQVHSIQQ